jgi:hypothetical protein
MKQIYELYNKTFSKEDNVLTGFKTKKKGFVIKKKNATHGADRAQTQREMINHYFNISKSHYKGHNASNMNEPMRHSGVLNSARNNKNPSIFSKHGQNRSKLNLRTNNTDMESMTDR